MSNQLAIACLGMFAMNVWALLALVQSWNRKDRPGRRLFGIAVIGGELVVAALAVMPRLAQLVYEALR